ncbi:unnamed protein product [Ceutorhynchus assimilis]|uniref:Uncharacterized protein n=1 Tax=Ceutorhynchus assimilis TaxID=467358 RepID=A0A9N9MJ07_9CUCU|nr:unnamed protein product [Ceutorhynchus assimilis]
MICALRPGYDPPNRKKLSGELLDTVYEEIENDLRSELSAEDASFTMMQDGWQQLLSELVKAIKCSKTAPDQVDLPLFNPDTTDAKKWLAEVGTIKTEFDWTDQQLLVRNLLKNLTDDSVPIRNLNLDRERVKSALDSNTKRDLRSNTKRRDTKVFQVGDFVLMHRDEKMHQGKLSYEFDGPFEVVGITPQQRYEIRIVGKSTITKAVKEQLRIWPTDWSLTLDMPDLLELLEQEFRRVTFHLFVGY